MQHSASLNLGLQLRCGLNEQGLEPGAQSCSAQAVVLHSIHSDSAGKGCCAQL